MTHGVDNPAIREERAADSSDHGERLADVLDDPHCRYLLKYLRDTGEPASVSEVATYVVSQLTDSPPDEVSTDVERRVQTWFYHGQLPMLDDYGVIDFDPDTGTVRLAEDAPA
ncbi:DUF7344 domain-containing protein [Halosimplex amylolyticum]|uniref:DUF7344 domain-containing protein n=1 Tax=Halosimplex amylolyticum TaxID=3396616 RepID=UPI003F55F672